MHKKFPMHFNATFTTKSNAKNLSRPLTPAENRFWQYVRSRKMEGYKFRRQHPIGKFIVDFYCHRLRLVVEIDGSIHELNHIKKYDLEREARLKELGLSILRFSNEDVFYNLAFVELTIKGFIELRRGVH
jgi:very-short-patch-repair endonuclease